MLYIGAICLDVLAKTACDLTVALQQILAGHACLTWSTTRRDDILGIGEGFLDVCSPGDVGTFETTVEHFLGYALKTGSVNVIKANVWGHSHGECGLYHVGANHTCGANNNEFVVSQISCHCFIVLMIIEYCIYCLGIL